MHAAHGIGERAVDVEQVRVEREELEAGVGH